MKTLLLLRSYLLLIKIDLIMQLRSLQSIHFLLRSRTAALEPSNTPLDVETICHAINLSCVFYMKPVLCLQRSAATALLLRRYGWKAEMVIGAQMLPFKSHAWVELDGRVVNDKPYMHEIYRVLERC
jgi:triphosphoribosyl-dephospho-CoA synthetase